jgi:hypothetical protein
LIADRVIKLDIDQALGVSVGDSPSGECGPETVQVDLRSRPLQRSAEEY